MNDTPFTPHHFAMSADGRTLAASYHPEGDELRIAIDLELPDRTFTTWNFTTSQREQPPPIALADDGAWLAVMLPGRLVKHAIPSGAELTTSPGTYARELSIGHGYFYAYDDAWHVDTLARERVDDSIPRHGHRRAHGTERWVVTLDKERLVLWDRERRRSSQLHRIVGGKHAVLVANRFALSLARGHLVSIDLVDGRSRMFPIPYSCSRLLAARDGSRLVVWDQRAWELELDWEVGGEPDALTARWGDVARPQIVDTLLPELQSRPAFPEDLQPIVQNHPELELALARWLPPATGAALTRKALQDPAMADRPEAWRQLANISLVAGDSAHAADAAAEAVARGRGSTDVLDRALAVERVRTAEVARRYSLHAGAVTGLAIHDDILVSTGDDGRIRTWSLATGERIASYDCKSPITALDILDGRAVVGTRDGRASIFDIHPLLRIARSVVSDAPIAAITINADHALVISDDDHLYWRTLTMDPIDRYHYRRGGALIAFPRAAREWQGDTLLLVERQFTRFHNRARTTLVGFGRYEHATALATHGPLLVGCLDGAVWLEETRLDGFATLIRCVHAADDVVVAAGFDRTVRWWIGTIPVAVAKHDALCVVTDGKLVLSAGDDGHVIIWD